jgi:RHH-type rel operon transcriptional repressor/antitoxin RelB
MDPLLERELELAAKRLGVTKSQFIISAVQRALGRKNPYELMLKLQAEEASGVYQTADEAPESREIPYETDASREFILRKLRAKHGVGGAG